VVVVVVAVAVAVVVGVVDVAAVVPCCSMLFPVGLSFR